MIIKKTSISFTEIKEKKVFSPLQFYDFKMSPKKAKPIIELLDSENLYEKGIEPGQKSYVEMSNLAFIRTSCIIGEKFRPDHRKLIYVNPHRYKSISLNVNDILLVKDGAIGESAIIDSTFLKESVGGFQLSSGVVKLNLMDINPFYLLAVLKSHVFRDQLYTRVGLGTTITHASDEFLKCEMPLPRDSNEEKVISMLSEAIVKKEEFVRLKCSQTVSEIDKEISTSRSSEIFPTYKTLKEKLRLDVSTYSSEYNQYVKEISEYSGGYSSISKLGFKPKRGPNLAVRDSGRILYSDRRINDGFWVVIKPEDLSFEGVLDRFQFMGNNQIKWSFSKGDVLFSAEGTIGKFFVFCEDVNRITTNYHSIMINHEDVRESVVLGCILGYLRERGILDKISVGAQGGSLALAHWDLLLVPKLKTNLKEKLFNLYYKQPNCKQTSDLISILQYHVAHSDGFGIFQLDTQIRYFKSILGELINCLAYDLPIDDRAIAYHINNSNFMQSFDSFNFDYPKKITESLDLFTK